MAYSNVIMSDFYCTQCGSKGLPVWRRRGAEREAGHLKKLFCLKCQTETNHIECKSNTHYTNEDFYIEFEYGNFTPEGQRVRPYGELRRLINNDQITKVKTVADGRSSGIREEYMAPDT